MTTTETTDFEQLKGRTVLDVDRVDDGEGDYLVIDFEGLRLYADAPTLYFAPENVAPPVEYPDPPEKLADAWQRFQRGEHVEPYEGRAIDEWRADVEREAFGA